MTVIWRFMSNLRDRIGLALWVSLLVGSGCFETGELGEDVPGVADVVGGVTPAGSPDASTPNPTEGQPCLTDNDCFTPGTSFCGPFVLCKNFECAQDPSTATHCDTGDPCLIGSCEPSTGACVNEDICGCVMADAPLNCGSKVSWAASDPQPPMTQVDGQACGQPYGGGVKRVWNFTAPSDQPVIIQSTGGAIASLSSLVSPQGDCQPAACMSRATNAVSFQPAAGANYAIVVEHLDPISPDSFELTVTCGASTTETICNDQIDEDFDGLVDCLDPDCLGIGSCPDMNETDCSNGVDDDANGLEDCDDPACLFATSCLEQCQEQISATCGFHQGLTTGGGKANATEYVCGPAAPGKEVVYGFSTDSPKTVHVKSGSFSGGVYVMKSPFGQDLCSPKYCEIYGPSEAYFAAQPFVQYYIAIDGPAGQDVSFNIEIECFD
jgi:hypothetical protein